MAVYPVNNRITPAPTGPGTSQKREAPQLVSVIMPVRNGSETLARQLEALRGQTYGGPWEFIVADNGSVDDTPSVAEEFAGRVPGLRVVDASGRPGISAARNAGAAAARGQFLAYCDADDEAAEGWLAGLVATAAYCDVVGGRLDHSSLNDRTAQAWRDTLAADGLPRSLGFLPYAVGSNMGIWSDVLRALGGWNEKYQTSGDDVELSWRAQLAGYSLGFAPNAVMRYRHRHDLRGMMKQAYAYGLSDARLYWQFRSAGLPLRPLIGDLRGWASLLARLPHLLGSRAHRGHWLRQATLRWSRLWGSARHRGWCL
jgi:glycosyltransferase involved in cell wall biosynthesis